MTANQIVNLASQTRVIRWDPKLVKEALQQRDELVPQLLDHMRSFYEQIRDPRREPDKASIFRFRNGYNLLGAMRETGAYPILLKFLALPTWQLKYAFDYDLSEGLRQVLCSVFDGNLEETERLAADISADQMARGTVVYVMGLLCQEGRIPRDELVRLLHEVLAREKVLDNEGFLIGVTETMELLHLHELCVDLRDFIVSGAINLRFCDETLDRVFQYDGVLGEEWVPDDPLFHPAGGPTAQERRILEWTAGRNDPCPCGSGRKFKACCLRKQETLHDKYPTYAYHDRYTVHYYVPPIIYPPIESVEGHPGLAAYFPREGIAVDEHAYRAIEIGGDYEDPIFNLENLTRIAEEELWKAFEGYEKICADHGYRTTQEYDLVYGVHYSSETWLQILADILASAADERLDAVEAWL